MDAGLVGAPRAGAEEGADEGTEGVTARMLVPRPVSRFERKAGTVAVGELGVKRFCPPCGQATDGRYSGGQPWPGEPGSRTERVAGPEKRAGPP